MIVLPSASAFAAPAWPMISGLGAPRVAGSRMEGPGDQTNQWHSASTAAGVVLGCVGLVGQRQSRIRSRSGVRPVASVDLTPRKSTSFHRRRAALVAVKAGNFMESLFAPKPKTVIITGTSSGLGLAAATSLAASGDWHIIMACRNPAKMQAAAEEAGIAEESFTILDLDLASMSSVRRFVEAFRALGRPLDALVCNAAVYLPNADKLFGSGPQFTEDGYEVSFAANYLGHFLLCNLLLDDLRGNFLKPAGRCVILGTVTASINDQDVGGKIPPLADLGQFEGLQQGMKKPITMIDNGAFIGAKAYKDSKLCCVMLMRELHKRFHSSTGVSFTSLYPGCITDTGLFREHYPAFRLFWPLLMKNVVKSYVSNAEAGARLASCVANPAYNVSGSYYSWAGEAGTGGGGGIDAVDNTEKDFDSLMQYGSFRTLGVDDIVGDAGDDARCRKLFELSEQLVGLR
eukprot:TRINITY_DN58710_c0_g1_i1.p1 TRINITY_DN58710_c0_g1~~TRINITY_DN58710_c0_g1_i1.p1  ORF type:complete len:459 (-),score=75.07 TRINITY_DN58710_c0_g1_i1:104-1480(-)